MSDDSDDRNDGENDRHGGDLKDRNDNDDNKVGYRKPPKHSRFKKGQSGNKKGRPKRSKDFDKIFSDQLEQLISLRVGEKTEKVPIRTAIAKSLINGALRLDRNCLKAVLDLMRKAPPSEPLGTSPEELDDLQRLLKNLPSEPEKLTVEEDESEKERKNDDAGDDGGSREALHE